MNKQENINKEEIKDNKDKLRVYEYAKSLSMSSKEIITILKRLDIAVNNHMSVMETNAVEGVEKFFRDTKANAAAKRAASETAAKAASAASDAPRPQSATPTISKEQPEQVKAEQPRVVQAAQSTTQAQSTPTTGTVTSAPLTSSSSANQSYNSSNTSGASRIQSSSSQSRPPQTYNRSTSSSQGSSSYGTSSDRPRPSGGYSSPSSSSQQRPSSGSSSQRPQGSSPSQRPAGSSSSQRPPGSTSSSPRPYSSSGSSGGVGSSQSRPTSGTGNSAPQRPGGTTTQRPADANRNRNNDIRRTSDINRAQNAPLTNSRPKPGIPTTANLDLETMSVLPKKAKPPQKRFDDNKPGSAKGGQQGRNKNGQKGRNNAPQIFKEKVDNTPKKIIVRGTMTVGELAKSLHKDVSEVIKKLLFLGVMANINQELDLDAIQLLSTEYGVEVELKIPVDEDNFELIEESDEDEDLIARPPVVTIMGHVDHGKTTLLDAIRHTSVTEGEAGGITQHIGAYQVEVHGKKITFLDTPGHEAFTMMRARGAQVTDITILVVAADDGVMPQTVEAINHAKAANVPIIVAINKIDKPGANSDRIKQEMTEYQLVPEEWGGDTVYVEVSAKQRLGLEHLLEMILLVAEVQELKANPNKRARGTVIEAELDKSRGPVARVLIQHGTLKVGDSFVAGVCFGRIRAMVNDHGKRLKEAGPSTPVEITGLSEVPQAGDPFLSYEDERKARIIADRRAITLRQSAVSANTRVTLEDLYSKIKDGVMKDLIVILKADVQGSLEALKGALEKIEIEGVRVKTIHMGVGAITESDIILASASNAIIFGFNVRPDAAVAATADQEKVEVRLHRVIYSVIEEIEAAMKGMLDPIFKENIIGHAEVRNTFKISKVGTIAGCMVTSGKISRSAEVRLIRAGIVVFEGKIDSLKRYKDDAKDVAQGYECGITLERFNDLKDGDIIEAFVMETVER